MNIKSLKQNNKKINAKKWLYLLIHTSKSSALDKKGRYELNLTHDKDRSANSKGVDSLPF